jgi:hypothetical protein
MNVELIGCPKTPVRNYHYMLHNIPEECRLFVFVTSFLYLSSEEDAAPSNCGGSLYNGDTQVLYWADANSEIAFVVPTRLHELDVSPQFDSTCESAHLSGQGNIYVFTLISKVRVPSGFEVIPYLSFGGSEFSHLSDLFVDFSAN